MAEADSQQGLLLVQLAQWGTAMGFEEASGVIFADAWDPEFAESSDPDVRRILLFGETVGTLVKQGLFSEELALDWIWVAGLWERVAPAARKAREKFDNAQLYENFEALAAKQTPV